MLAIILLFPGVFSTLNPIQHEIDTCKHIGRDLSLCAATANCKFYEITKRRTWDLDHALEVAIRAPDGGQFSWYTGTITNIDGTYITVTRTGCDPTTEQIPCSVRESRYSFQFRESPNPFEFVGMRVEVYRDYFGRWIETNLTKIGGDETPWSDLWAYGGEFGDIVGLTPFDVRASQGQDCQLDPEQIPIIAQEIVAGSGQRSESQYCAEIYKESLCTDNTWETLNCQWNATYSTCLLNEETNILIGCWAHSSDEYACTDDPNCRWIAPTMDNQADSYCVNSSSALSILFLALIVLLLC